MTYQRLTNTKEYLSDAFRRYGLEGESAFQVLACHYALHSPAQMTNLPADITRRWQAAHQRIENAPHIRQRLDELVSGDPTGGQLPEWYQFFIGRRFRESSGKFFTPMPIARAMVRLLPPRLNPVIMDPTSGGGTFLAEASRIWQSTAGTFIANDVETSLVELSMVTLALSTPQRHRKHYSAVNIFDPTETLTRWYGAVDYVLANPPFSLRIEHEQFDSPLFRAGYRNSDALFLDLALKLLKPGGRLVCLLPHSIVANAEFVELRAIVENAWQILGVVCLPEGVFHLSAGTTTRADIVIAEKRRARAERAKPAIFASVPTVGLPLNRLTKTPVTNELEKVLDNTEVRAALSLSNGREA